MKVATKVAHWTLRGSGALVLSLGLIIWVGHGDQLVEVHKVLGFVLVFSLWILAAIAARSRVSIGLIIAAVVLGLMAPILGFAQEELVFGRWQWVIQVLHLVIGLSAIVLGERLVISMRQIETTSGPHPRPT